MLKFQLRPSNATSASAGHSPASFASSSFSSSPSACSSPSISSINSSSLASSQQRLSQISSTFSRENDDEMQMEGQEEPPSPPSNRRPLCSSPSPSLPDSLPPPMGSPLLAPPIPPKPASFKSTRAKSSERPSGNKGGEFGHLRVYTAQIKADTDYKTLRIGQNASTAEVIRQLVEEKLRLNLRDLNLFHLFMEVRTMRRGDGAAEVRSILELDVRACPLELQRCHPEGRSRFILGMDSNAILARIYDGEICPESNYKSVFISRRTTCIQVLAMLHQMCRLGQQNSEKGSRKSAEHSLGIEAISELRLFVQSQTGGSVECLIPSDCCLAGVYLSLLPGQKIVLRRVIVPRNDGFLFRINSTNKS